MSNKNRQLVIDIIQALIKEMPITDKTWEFNADSEEPLIRQVTGLFPDLMLRKMLVKLDKGKFPDFGFQPKPDRPDAPIVTYSDSHHDQHHNAHHNQHYAAHHDDHHDAHYNKHHNAHHDAMYLREPTPEDIHRFKPEDTKFEEITPTLNHERFQIRDEKFGGIVTSTSGSIAYALNKRAYAICKLCNGKNNAAAISKETNIESLVVEKFLVTLSILDIVKEAL